MLCNLRWALVPGTAPAVPCSMARCSWAENQARLASLCGTVDPAPAPLPPLLGQDAIADLDGEAVLQVVDAHLAHILGPGAVATYLHALQPTARTGLPSEYREGRFADFARLAVRLLRHANVRVISQARLADERELGILPLGLVVVLFDAGHVCELKAEKGEKTQHTGVAAINERR